MNLYAFAQHNPMALCNNPVGRGVFENLLGAAKGERNVLPQGDKGMGAAQAQGTLDDFVQTLGLKPLSEILSWAFVKKAFNDILAYMFNDPLSFILGSVNIFVLIIQIVCHFLFGGDDVTLSQERTNTFALQDACFALLSQDDYKEINWANHTTAKRKQLLATLFANVQEIMGTSINSAISWENMGSNAGDPKGGYSPRSDDGTRPKINVMTLNNQYLERDNSRELVFTVIHEVRHAFQQEAVLDINDHVVCADTISAWAKNLPSYAKGRDVTGPGYYGESGYSDHMKYVLQAIEWDSRLFAKQYDTLKDQDLEAIPNPSDFPADYLTRFYAGIWGNVPVER